MTAAVPVKGMLLTLALWGLILAVVVYYNDLILRNLLQDESRTWVILASSRLGQTLLTLIVITMMMILVVILQRTLRLSDEVIFKT